MGCGCVCACVVDWIGPIWYVLIGLGMDHCSNNLTQIIINALFKGGELTLKKSPKTYYVLEWMYFKGRKQRSQIKSRIHGAIFYGC